MRRLEAALTNQPQTLSRLAFDVYEITVAGEPTRAQIESLRRAAKQLAATGRAEVLKALEERPVMYSDGSWSEATKMVLVVRTPLTEQEQKAERREPEAILSMIGEYREAKR